MTDTYISKTQFLAFLRDRQHDQDEVVANSKATNALDLYRQMPIPSLVRLVYDVLPDTREGILAAITKSVQVFMERRLGKSPGTVKSVENTEANWVEFYTNAHIREDLAQQAATATCRGWSVLAQGVDYVESAADIVYVVSILTSVTPTDTARDEYNRWSQIVLELAPYHRIAPLIRGV